nr:zinc finger MYM-type protein 1-like [Malus domestica]
MERYYKRKSSLISSDNHIPNSSPSNLDSSNPIPNSSPTSAPIPNSSDPIRGNSTPQQNELIVDLDNLERDPGKRIPMKDYPPNIRDEVRRAYILMEPFRAKDHDFPFTLHSNKKRRFVGNWLKEFHWLEYSKSKDAAFCFYCYLFKVNSEQSGSDVFTEVGFQNWKHARACFEKHVGMVGSFHNKAIEAAGNLMNQKTHIETVVVKQSEEARMAYRTCLNASIDCTKFLLRQGLSFRGHDESDTSNNRGNYLELLQFLADHDEKIKDVVLDKASGNLKLIASTIQKDLVHSCSIETIKSIISDMKNARFFSLLVDEARDVSIKEQMAVVLRYVDKNRKVIERFVGVQHVPDTTSNTLKESIDAFINFNELSFSNLRGQGYDGASTMKGEFNGLKTKILNEQPCAFYVHCFAHQLQLALVAVAKDNVDVNTFFLLANNVVNNIGASCKRRDALREMQQKELMKALENDSLMTGRGLNQETSLKRAGATRWNSHYGTLISLISMYSSVVNVLEMIVDDNTNDSVAEANRLLRDVQSFEFVFLLFLMKSILGITNDLSQALQKNDQEIVNAMALVNTCKEQLLYMRNDEGFDLLVDKVSSFCVQHHIEIINMDEAYVAQGRSRPLVLPVATASVERSFSAMNIIKSPLHNRMGDQWLNDSLVVYIEKDVFSLRLGPKITETVKGKLRLGAKIVKTGGTLELFKYTFNVNVGEKLLKASQ